MFVNYKQYDFDINKITPCPICLNKQVYCAMGYRMDNSSSHDDRDTYGYLECSNCNFMVEYNAYTYEGSRKDIIEDGLAEQWNEFYSKRKEKKDVEQSKEKRS